MKTNKNISLLDEPYSLEAPVNTNRKILSRALTFQFIYSLIGLIIGITCILGGIVLFLNGIAGSSDWSAEILGINSTLSDTAPGAILFIVGLFIVYITRFGVIINNKYRRKK